MAGRALRHIGQEMRRGRVGRLNLHADNREFKSLRSNDLALADSTAGTSTVE